MKWRCMFDVQPWLMFISCWLFSPSDPPYSFWPDEPVFGKGLPSELRWEGRSNKRIEFEWNRRQKSCQSLDEPPSRVKNDWPQFIRRRGRWGARPASSAATPEKPSWAARLSRPPRGAKRNTKVSWFALDVKSTRSQRQRPAKPQSQRCQLHRSNPRASVQSMDLFRLHTMSLSVARNQAENNLGSMSRQQKTC